jgi:Spy/CpxP family protein refolding chaperone
VTHGIANKLTLRNKTGTCHKITNCHTRQLRLSTGMDISVKDLQEAISIRQQIDNLQRRLSSLLRGAPQRPTGPTAPTVAGRYFSPATRAKLAAAARARWARRRGIGAAVPAKRKGQLTPAGRRKLSQLMKARWAARRKAGGKQKASGRKKGALTPAGRRRLSELMKARWAARRKAGSK